MPSDYIEKNSVIPIKTTSEVVRIDEVESYSKSHKKAQDTYEDLLEQRQMEANMRDPWDE